MHETVGQQEIMLTDKMKTNLTLTVRNIRST